MIGAQTLHATGYAMGLQRDGVIGTGDPERDAAVIGYFGDGATSQGDVNEAFIWASVFNAPVVFFCQNNQWAISEPIERQTRIPLYQRALGFGFPGLRVDGNDVLAVYAVTQAALQRAREGSGPTFVEAYTYRMGAHTTSDDPTRYRVSDDLEHWKLKDPIERVKAYLSRNGLADDDYYAEIEAEADELAVRLRKGCLEMPDPSPLDIFDQVYEEITPELEAQQAQFAAYLSSFEVPGVARGSALMTAITLAKGVKMGLRAAMEDDPKVIIMGEDVGKLGGVFRVTDGLQKDFGEDRVIDTPLAESGHPRHRGRPRDARLPAGLRDPVRRLRLPGVRPDRQPGRQDALPQPRPDQDADRHPDPVRRRHRRGRAPQREPRGVLRPHRRSQGRRLLQPGRRLLDDPAGHRVRRPDRLPRAEAPLLGEGRARRVDSTPEPLFASRVVARAPT